MINEQKSRRIVAIGILPLLAILIYPASSSASSPLIVPGSTVSFGVLAATTITNTGATTVGGTAGGNIGLSPGTAFMDSSTVTASGTIHIADPVAAAAQADLASAYADAGTPTPTVLTSADLAAQVITPGVYSSNAGTFANSGAFTLDAKGDANAVFVFQTASTLTTAASSTMTLVNGAQASNVYWRVGGAATLGANSTFVGNLYALNSITANSGAKVQGQLLSRTGAVNLNANTITNTAFVAPVIPGTLIVIKKVVNTYGGTAVASDFMIHVTQFGSEVAGSPVAGADGTGTTYTLVPGTYLISEGSHDGYYGTFGSTDPAIVSSLKDGLVTVVSGQVVTVIRTNYQVAPAYVPTATPTPSPVPTTPASTGTPTTTTQSGGTLPKTGSPWYNLLAIAAGLILLGGVGFKTKKVLR